MPEPHWQDIMSTYFQFCREKFNDVPTMDGSGPRDLRLIVVALRKRAEKSGTEWDHDTATARFRHFLEYAYATEPWLRDHWTLSILNRQKDAIFFNHSKQQK
jgi:hypothetical protein